MYAVVGCGNCEALWVVAGRPETTGCPRCGKRHRFQRLKRFVETDDEDGARQARAELLAERSGHGEAFARFGTFDDLAADVDALDVDEEEYLGAAGVDVDAVQSAADRARSGAGKRTGSRQEVVRAALRELDAPSEEAVVDYAVERGVPEDATRRLVRRLVEAGEASEHRGRYRLL